MSGIISLSVGLSKYDYRESNVKAESVSVIFIRLLTS